MTAFTSADIPDMTGKTVVVTGASDGIGRSVARDLAAAGACVVLAVRSTEKGNEAAAGMTGATELHELDLASLDSVRAFAAAWRGPLDVLINNAGVSAPSLTRTADGFESDFGVNHLGHFALTNLLLEHITGRVVTVASRAERLARLDLEDPNWEHRQFVSRRAYNDSKLANLLFTAELQRRLAAAGSDVLANAAHPGLVSTNMYHQNGGGVSIWRLLLALLAQDPDQGALPVLYAAVADVPGNSFAGPSHFAHMRGAPQLIDRSDTAKDPELARRLWTLSEQLTDIQPRI